MGEVRQPGRTEDHRQAERRHGEQRREHQAADGELQRLDREAGAARTRGSPIGKVTHWSLSGLNRHGAARAAGSRSVSSGRVSSSRVTVNDLPRIDAAVAGERRVRRCRRRRWWPRRHRAGLVLDGDVDALDADLGRLPRGRRSARGSGSCRRRRARLAAPFGRAADIGAVAAAARRDRRGDGPASRAREQRSQPRASRDRGVCPIECNGPPFRRPGGVVAQDNTEITG